jgi:hypothetical protein
MNRLREHTPEQFENAPSTDHAQNVVQFSADTTQQRTSSALDLVSRVASIIRELQEQATETEARARALAETALERLRQAETRTNDAETARARAEDTVARLSARLQEAERELKHTHARVVAGRLLLLQPCLQKPRPPPSLSQSHSLAFMAHKTALHVRANRSATTAYSKMVIAPSDNLRNSPRDPGDINQYWRPCRREAE